MYKNWDSYNKSKRKLSDVIKNSKSLLLCCIKINYFKYKTFNLDHYMYILSYS